MLGVCPAAAQDASVTIEKLLADGWEIGGYVSAWENRSLILFRHKGPPASCNPPC
jgi:hypothetical protein